MEYLILATNRADIRTMHLQTHDLILDGKEMKAKAYRDKGNL